MRIVKILNRPVIVVPNLEVAQNMFKGFNIVNRPEIKVVTNAEEFVELRNLILNSGGVSFNTEDKR